MYILWLNRNITCTLLRYKSNKTKKKTKRLTSVYITLMNYRWSSQRDWFYRLSRYSESEKSNQVEMTNDNLFMAILPMKTTSISLAMPRVPLVSSYNFHITRLHWERKLSVSKIKGKFCKIAIMYVIPILNLHIVLTLSVLTSNFKTNKYFFYSAWRPVFGTEMIYTFPFD